MRTLQMAVAVLSACACRASESVTLVDFSKPGHGWVGNARTKFAQSDAGLVVELTGEDPWTEGPDVPVPGFGKAAKLAVRLEAECSTAGACQLYFAPPRAGFSEERTAALAPLPGVPGAYAGVIPLASERMRFRIDPPGESGRFLLRALRGTALVPLTTPAFAKPVPVALPEAALSLESGPVRVAHDVSRWNAFACFIDGHKMAEANPSEALAYWDGSRAVQVPLAAAQVTATKQADGFAVEAKVSDAGGAEWRVTRTFTAERGAVRVETALTVSEPREAVHLPWLTLFAGLGAFGEHKSQALLSGVEYLEDEPSSSEKEIRGAAANRRLVDAYKVCYPMMALAAEGRWFSVTWQPGEVPVSPLFDTPDRVFGSGGHAFGLWSPAVGDVRFEGELTVYGGVKLQANKAYGCSATVCGGKGGVVTEAVGDFVARHGLPPLPHYKGEFDAAVRLLASGWLDSSSRHGNLWRHAVWGTSFQPALAEDPPAYMLWLAANTSDAALKARLRETSQSVIANLPKDAACVSGLSHVARPTGALLYGNLAGAVNQARARAAQRAAALESGVSHYRPAEGKPDYASTLGSDTCNGFTSLEAEAMLADAALIGDEAVIGAALAVLDKMTANYTGQVPRGAQPWEMPLHTPDIVASARLVHCYVLGYLLSGKPEYLDQARYWAWTGVTMVYLAPPTSGEVGLYATIGVMGATNWQAPNWIGQPVQWCGLVFRSALEDLARIDGVQHATWQTLARGITVTGLQMCYPLDDPQRRGGLLPDFFLLKPQISDGPAINPGTLGANLAEAYGKTPLYTATRLANGSLAHVPGEVRQEATAGSAVKLAITAWPEDGYRVLITRMERAPARIEWNGAAVTPEFLADARVLIVPLKGSGTLAWTPQ